jgi:hypothetical protein
VSRILTAVIVMLSMAGCHRVHAPASVVRSADPNTANQLIGGFYPVEGEGDNRWRWVGPDATLVLAPPIPASKGARFRLRLYFPETQIHEIGPITLAAIVGGQALQPETFSKGGSYEFVRDVPACSLNTNLLPIRICFDKFTPKSETDGRDLAAVVLMAALEAKQ